MKQSTKKAPASSVGTGRARRAILYAGHRGLTADEIWTAAGHTTAQLSISRAVSGSGIRLEKARISNPGEITERQIYRLKSRSDAISLITFANRCADKWGYEAIPEAEAQEILALYPSNTE